MKPFAKKSFGQNFLVDKNYIDKIVNALDPQTGDVVIEIGAGRGALTEKLVESGARVIAVELDRDLIPLLNEKFAGNENFSLIEQDALKINFDELLQKPKTKDQTRRQSALLHFDRHSAKINRAAREFFGNGFDVSARSRRAHHRRDGK